eukprot:CAMPEP_0116114728 /NCGR_PEP_ID=MMETSP0329-20121206/131_1 /TAXON_ID=697910 /ORGANISM="Pseudo-nitzschia arenysensis, Strain B593" /LENGTH=375 /DNA_ID=CAMNT_0003608119 /DNA_START=57 /DNA_END=1184 /DNA_ORIENTATION=+
MGTSSTCGHRKIIALVLLAFAASVQVLFLSKEISGIPEPSVVKTGNRTNANNAVNSHTYVYNNVGKQENCLDLGLDSNMDLLLSDYKQVFVIMAAKAAGTTLTSFTRECMKSTNTSSFQQTSHIVHFDQDMRNAFTSQLKMPTLVTSHIALPKYFRKLIEHATTDSLIIYSHRDESSRLLSAIKEVIVKRMCFGDTNDYEKKEPGVAIVDNKCHVTEEKLIDTILGKRNEIGSGVLRLLTCEVYESVEDNRPNLVFMHYKQATKLQKLLAKHHCPNVRHDIRVNVGSNKDPVSIILGGPTNNGTLVDLDDWLDAKSQLMEYALATKEKVSIDGAEGVSCQATTRTIEDLMFSCPSETLFVSGGSHSSLQAVQFPF